MTACIRVRHRIDWIIPTYIVAKPMPSLGVAKIRGGLTAHVVKPPRRPHVAVTPILIGKPLSVDERRPDTATDQITGE